MGKPNNPLGRRTVVAGAGAVGALAAAASLLPGRAAQPSATPEPGKQVADSSAGYRLSDHVKQYYQTTRI